MRENLWDLDTGWGGTPKITNNYNDAIWGPKKAQSAIDANRQKKKKHKYNSVPEGSTFFKDKIRRNEQKLAQENKNKDKNKNKSKKHDPSQERSTANTNHSGKRKMSARGTDPRHLSLAERQKEKNVDRLAEQRSILNKFIEEYLKVSQISGSIIDVIDDFIGDVADIIKDYYEPKYNGIIREMNDCIQIMSTKRFANALFRALDNDLIENWTTESTGRSGIWNSVARMISIVLDTSHTQMQDETVSVYVDDILKSSFVWKHDIDKLVRNTGIDEEFATDLMINIPVYEEDFTEATLNVYTNRFLNILIQNAEDNKEVMMKNVQFEIFTNVFGEERIALKVIGKYLDLNLADVHVNNPEVEIILDEFFDMLYEFLDDFEIKEIEYVLLYLSKRERQREVDRNAKLERGEEVSDEKYQRIFDVKYLDQYPNISKAYNNIQNTKPEYAQYLK